MNILGIDFEDWYHPELIQNHVEEKKRIPKIVFGIDKILDFLKNNNTKATFFIVGDLIKHNPELVDKILENDHEIGFHTMNHVRLDKINQDEFEKQIDEFDVLTNGKSIGFRAPTFSLNEKSSWVINTLKNKKYQYDSSVVPAKTRMYGIPTAELRPYRISQENLVTDTINGILEFPIMITKFFRKKIPAGGGFYLRILPTKTIINSIKSYEKQNIPATFYIHSWELLPELMPKIPLPIIDNFITYHNLTKAKIKMEEILKKFEFTSFEEYIKKNEINL